MTTITAVPFHGDTVLAVQQGDDVLVALKPICSRLGLDWEGQRQRIRRDEILSEGAYMIQAPSLGGMQSTLFLPLELLHGWLWGVDEKRVSPECRKRLLAYKRECYRVVSRHFMAQRSAHRRGGFAPEYALPKPSARRSNRIQHWLSIKRAAEAVLWELGYDELDDPVPFYREDL